MKIFKLFECCKPVCGASRALISDTQRQAFQYIPIGLFEILTTHKNKTADEIKKAYNNEYDKEIDEYFSFLVREQYGFWCHYEEIDNFPPIDDVFESPEHINNAIIDIGTLSDHDFEKIFKELKDLRCKFLELRFFISYDLKALSAIIDLAKNTLLKNIDIYIKYDERVQEDDYFEKILNKRFIVGKLIVHSSPENIFYNNTAKHALAFIKQKITSSDCCGNISLYDFSTDLKVYNEALKYNTCLNKKISIDESGKIKNCPSMTDNFGDHKNTSLSFVANQNNFKYLWNINKDQIDVCKDCEHRYICTDCRAFVENTFDKPKKCNYNPYTCEWENS